MTTKFTQLAQSFKQAQESGSVISDLFKQPRPTFKVPERTPVAKDVGVKGIKSISNFTKMVLQETARSGGSIGLSLTGKKEQKPETGFLGKVQRFIFGEKPLESIGTRKERLPERAKEFGISESISKPLALPVILGLTAIDFVGLGGQTKTLKTLAKTKTIKEILPTLKKLGITDDVAPSIAKQIAKTTDVNEIKTLLKTTPDIPTTTLQQEAKKYDSADEFIKKVDDERITFKTKDGKSSVTVTESTPEYELVDDITQSQLEKLGLDSDDFITKIEHIEVDKSLQGKGLGTKLMNRAIKETIENGHDFVYLNASPMGNKGLSLDGLTKFYEEFGFKIIKKQGNNNLMGATKSQLKDIYNKANKPLGDLTK